MPSFSSRFASRVTPPPDFDKNPANFSDLFKSFIFLLCCASSASLIAAEDSPALVADNTATAASSADFFIEVQSDTTDALVDTALNTESISVVGRINPQAEDIGKQVDIFVVDSMDTGLIMKTADGQFLDWSGEVSDLEPAIDNVILTDAMSVDVFNGVLDYVGDHNFYLGYRLEGESELVYSPAAASLQIVPEESLTTAAGSGSEAEIRQSQALTAEAPGGSAPVMALATTNAPVLSIAAASIAPGASTSMWWSGVGPCTSSSSPHYSKWSGASRPASSRGGISPATTTTFTLTCANGTTSRTLTVTGGTTPPPPPPPTSATPVLAIAAASIAPGASTNMWWSGVAPCTASSSPHYSKWSGTVRNASSRGGISPAVTTTFTLTCANGTTSRTLTVGGGGTTPPPPTPGDGDIVPLPVPLTRTLAPMTSSALDVAVLNFSHTANREWDYGGHNVPDTFSGNGFWDYTDSYIAAWLFDRPTSWYQLYALTNNATHRANAIRDTAYYASRINSEGYFIPKVLQGEKDTKYGYVTPFLWYERLTGNTQYRSVAQKIYEASVKGYSTAYPITAGLWTEREAGIHGEAALSWYELTKSQAALNRAGAIVRQVGQLAAANGGAPQVPYWRHEGGGESFLTNSPWMTAFYFQFARRYYEITGDQAVLRQVSAYFDWLDVNGLYDSSRLGTAGGMTIPRYLTGPQSGDAVYSFGDPMHCLDVAGIVAFAVDAKQRLGLSTAKASQRLTELKSCATTNFGNWTRTTTNLPKYRITPERAWMWWMRGRYELLP